MNKMRLKLGSLLLCIALLISLVAGAVTAEAATQSNDTDFMVGKYGLFFHYLHAFYHGSGGTMDAWNESVNSFDVEKFAAAAEEMGASWVYMTLTQADGIYCIPIPEMEEFIDNSSKLGTERDLVNDLSEALSKRGIKLMLYWIPGAPSTYNRLAKALGAAERNGNATEGGAQTGDYKMNWTLAKNMASVMSSVSQRYGDKISGWWIDGCYDSILFNDRVAELEARALKSGNKNAVVAFNNGTRAHDCRFESEDYSAGEINNPGSNDYITNYSLDDRWTDNGFQAHFLTYLGTNWGANGTIYGTQDLCEHVYNNVLAPGGAISFDLRCEVDGTINSEQMAQLVALKKYVKDKPVAQVDQPYQNTGKTDSSTDTDSSDSSDSSKAEETDNATVKESKKTNNSPALTIIVICEAAIAVVLVTLVVVSLAKKKRRKPKNP